MLPHSSNGFIENPTFRGMRQHLLNTFNKIFIIDLFGDGNLKDDENVFDIKTSVSINIFIKDKSNEKIINYYPLIGSRKFKYDFLNKNSLKKIQFEKIKTTSPMYYLKKINFANEDVYSQGFSIEDLFPKGGNGIVSGRDQLLIKKSIKELQYTYDILTSKLPVEGIREKLELEADSNNWKLINAINDIQKSSIKKGDYIPILYRPFDIRYTYFTGNSSGYMARPIGAIMKNYIYHNIGLVTAKRNTRQNIDHFFICKTITEAKAGESSIQSKNFPLYIYPDNTDEYLININNKRLPNLKVEILNIISQKLNITFAPEKSNKKNTFSPIDIIDYIYANLYSPTYRQKYFELLKMDYPYIPYPENASIFWKLVSYGKELRKLHLMESSKLNKLITTFPNDGNRKVDKICFENNKNGKVWINNAQFFYKVPKTAWEFYIGGYQPAQKWLKDRKNRELSFDDIQHYQKIIVALNETDRIMNEIDKIHKF